MTTDQLSVAGDQFVGDLRRALYRLYDPAGLRHNPLFALFGPEHHGSPSALQDLLVGAIRRLKPAVGVSPQSDAWRTYRLLMHRFVEQFSQSEVAADLGLSLRQLRRHERQALQTLADALWRYYDLEARHVGEAGAAQAESRKQISVRESGEDAGRTDVALQEIESTAYAQELSWLSRSLPLEQADLGELVNATLETAAPLLEALGVHLICELPSRLPYVTVQCGPIRQTLLILFSEAIRSVPGGQLILEASAQAYQVVIAVRASAARGSATGAPPAADPGRFEIAQRLAALSGSELSISAGLDGAAFAARLAIPAARLLSILFVDDNADAQQLFQRCLAGTRYAYFGSRDAEQALALAETASPNVIVLDVMLPHVDGWELLGRLRVHPRTRETPVIVCSILPLEQLAFRLGAAAFVRKPITREMLLSVLDQQVSALAKG